MFLTPNHAKHLKYFIWGRLPQEVLNKIPMEIMNEINKAIDKAVGYDLEQTQSYIEEVND